MWLKPKFTEILLWNTTHYCLSNESRNMEPPVPNASITLGNTKGCTERIQRAGATSKLNFCHGKGLSAQHQPVQISDFFRHGRMGSKERSCLLLPKTEMTKSDYVGVPHSMSGQNISLVILQLHQTSAGPELTPNSLKILPKLKVMSIPLAEYSNTDPELFCIELNKFSRTIYCTNSELMLVLKMLSNAELLQKPAVSENTPPLLWEFEFRRSLSGTPCTLMVLNHTKCSTVMLVALGEWWAGSAETATHQTWHSQLKPLQWQAAAPLQNSSVHRRTPLCVSTQCTQERATHCKYLQNTEHDPPFKTKI